MLELLALGFVLTLVLVGLVFLGFVAAIARLVGWVLLLPFHILGWLLGGLGMLIALPFVILGLLLGAIGFGVGALVLFVPLLPFIVCAAAIVWLIRRGRRGAVAAR